MINVNNNLFVMPKNIQTRWTSAENPKGMKGRGGQKNEGRKGAPYFEIEPGQQLVLAEVEGLSGTIRRIWSTISERTPDFLRGLRLDFYWDGSKKPAISVPFGDFFGHGLGMMATFQSSAFTSPEGRSFNCFIPMPFKTGVKIIITNETSIKLNTFYYDIDYTIGDKHDDNMLYFHAYFNRQNPTVLLKDYEILPRIYGRGRFIGTNFGVRTSKERYFKSWWGEGEVKVYLDGDEEYPTLCGTGAEDYIGTGWCLDRYSNLYQGCTLLDSEKGRICFYRYHIPDPIYFYEDILITIQQIGCWDPDSKKQMYWAGEEIFSPGVMNKPLDFSKAEGSAEGGLFERQDDWSSCSYFYFDKPENDLQVLDLDNRITDLE